MENEQPREDEEPQDQSVEEFKEEVENDPSTAQTPDEDGSDAERLRGG